MANDVASMDAAAMLAAARADTSPAAEVVRLRTGLPPKPRKRLGPLMVLVFTFAAVVFVLAPPRNEVFNDLPSLAIVVLIVFGILALGASFVLVAKSSAPDERLLLAVWYLRHMLAAGDEQHAPVVQQTSQDSRPGVATRHPHVLWADDLTRARRYNGFMRWFDSVSVALILALFISYTKPCLPLPFGASCLPLNFWPPPFYSLWIGVVALSNVTKDLWMSTCTAVADADGIRLRVGRQRERHVDWGQVRSLTRLTFRNDATYTPHYFYVLDAGDTVLAWGYNIIVSKSIHHMLRPRNRPQDDPLAQAVIAYSGIPLRDGSFLAQAVARASKGYFDPNWPKFLIVPSDSLPTESLSQLEAAMMEVGPHQEFEKRDLLAFVLLAAYIVFCVAAWMIWI